VASSRSANGLVNDLACHLDELAHEAGRYMSDGLVTFLRPGWHRMFRVPTTVPEVATIGDRFVISPLLRVVTGAAHFLVLTVSQRRVRLLEGCRAALTSPPSIDTEHRRSKGRQARMWVLGSQRTE
jgi:hypothetical protein